MDLYVVEAADPTRNGTIGRYEFEAGKSGPYCAAEANRLMAFVSGTRKRIGTMRETLLLLGQTDAETPEEKALLKGRAEEILADLGQSDGPTLEDEILGADEPADAGDGAPGDAASEAGSSEDGDSVEVLDDGTIEINGEPVEVPEDADIPKYQALQGKVSDWPVKPPNQKKATLRAFYYVFEVVREE